MIGRDRLERSGGEKEAKRREVFLLGGFCLMGFDVFGFVDFFWCCFLFPKEEKRRAGVGKGKQMG